jgi:hypothetical protein
MIAMSIYVVVFLTVWPLARGAADPLTKVAYALTPVLPLFYVIWLMARRILQSDELEQRTHLIGLGVSAAVVSILSIVSGFLAAANVMTLEAASIVLVWIFPLLMISYGIARSYAARRYGGSGCDEDDCTPAYLRFLYAAVVFCFIAVYVYFRTGDEEGVAITLGMAVALGAGAAFFAIRRWRRRRLPSG